MSFSSDLKDFTVKVETNSEKVVRGTALSMFRRVILRSPVKTGRFRGNWQVELNRAANGVLEANDSTGGKAIAASVTKTARFKLGQSIYMVNNLPYAIPLEEGSSQQAPLGMVKVTVTEFKREIDKQVRKLK